MHRLLTKGIAITLLTGKSVIFFTLLFTTVLILFKVADYYDAHYWAGYLSDKKEFYYGVFRLVFIVHISTAPLLAIIGLFIFSGIQKDNKRLHRVLGKIYVVTTLVVCAPSGLFLSFYAFGGIVSKLSFVLLSVLWFFVTFKAFLLIRDGKVEEHRTMMTRSFIFLISALNLRIICFVFIQFFNWSGPEMYTTAGVISWVVPLMFYEITIRLLNR